MSNHPFTKPINISLKHTTQKMMILVLPHLLALLVVLTIDIIPLLFKGLISIIIVASFYYYCRLYLFDSSKHSITSIQNDSVENWYLTSANNVKISVSLLPSSFSSNILIILNYVDIKKQKYSVIITPDCLSKNDFRRLRVGLKSTKLLINKI